ncbi:MAG: oligosaccharide flippase family protein [Rhizobacter sp.]|nr:oligosaccharide flippase family protein [Ferruginibacter sp.]
MATSAKYNSWVHAGFYSGLQKLSVPLSSIFITMILTKKVLTVEEVSIWGLLMTATAILELIRQGLVKTAMIKYINSCEAADEKNVIAAGFYLNAIITVIVAIVMFALTPWLAEVFHAPKLENMLYILQIALVINIPFSHFEWLMYGKQLFKGLYWTYLVRQGLTLALVACMLFIPFEQPLYVLVVIYVIAMLAGTVMAYKFVKHYLHGAYTFSGEWIVRLFHFGKYVFASGISTLVFRNADQMLMPSILKTPIYNAFQGLALRVISLSDLPSQTLGDILFPKTAHSKNNSNPQVLKYYYEKTVGASLCLIIPLLLLVFIFPKLVILVLANEDYYAAIPYMRLILITAVTLSFLKQFGVIMDSTGKQIHNLVSISFLAILQVALCYIFIRRYELMGAGYALLISHAVGFIVTQSMLYYYYKINFLNAFKYAVKFYPEFYHIIAQKLPWKKAK